jgi:hypothetical protein
MSRPSWYLDSVKEKKTHKWTTKEMSSIYTLRKELKIPSGKIAELFNVSTIQIYNVTRLVKKAYKNQCFICGHNLSKVDIKKYKNKFIKACSSCREKQMEYKRERRNKVLKKGLCGYCEKNEVIPGYTACTKCISATYRRRYVKKLCGRCGKHPIYKKRSRALCINCLEKKKTNRKK